MPRFIPTKSGDINLDAVISIDGYDTPLITYRCGDEVLTTR
jgi:hypothetical protein